MKSKSVIVKALVICGGILAANTCNASQQFNDTFRGISDITRKNMNNWNQTMSGFMSTMQPVGGSLPFRQPALMQQFNPSLLQQDPAVIQSMIQAAPIVNHLLQVKPIVEQLAANMSYEERQFAQIWMLTALQQLSVNSLPPDYVSSFWRSWRNDIRLGKSSNLVYATHAICVIALIDPDFAENLQEIFGIINRSREKDSGEAIGRATPKYA